MQQAIYFMQYCIKQRTALAGIADPFEESLDNVEHADIVDENDGENHFNHYMFYKTLALSLLSS